MRLETLSRIPMEGIINSSDCPTNEEFCYNSYYDSFPSLSSRWEVREDLVWIRYLFRPRPLPNQYRGSHLIIRIVIHRKRVRIKNLRRQKLKSVRSSLLLWDELVLFDRVLWRLFWSKFVKVQFKKQLFWNARFSDNTWADSCILVLASSGCHRMWSG